MTSKTSPMLLPAVSSKLFSYIRQNTFKICIHVSKYIEWNILLTFSYVFDVEILFATSFIITADSQLPRNVHTASNACLSQTYYVMRIFLTTRSFCLGVIVLTLLIIVDVVILPLSIPIILESKKFGNIHNCIISLLYQVQENWKVSK